MIRISIITGMLLIICNLSARSEISFIESAYELNMNQQDYSSGIIIADIDNDLINEVFLTNFTGDHRLYIRSGNNMNDMGGYYGINGPNNEYLNVSVTDVNLDSLPDFFLTGAQYGYYGKLLVSDYPNAYQEMAQLYNLQLINSIGAAFFQLSPQHGLSVLNGSKLMVLSENAFVDITAGSGLENLSNVFCPVFFDIDGDYDDDLFIAGNWELNYGTLFRNNGDGSFTDISTNTNQGGFGYGQEVTFGDIDNDGDFDIYLCSGFGTNSLWQNDGTGYFTDITAQSNTGCDGYSRGASFADFDNDGDLDLFVNRATAPKILYRNDSTGVFTNVSVEAGVSVLGNGFGCSSGDIDNDGHMDIMAANCCYQQNFIFINQATDSNFVKIKVKGRNSNTLALGAIVELYAFSDTSRSFEFMAMREISSHSTLHGNNDLVVHFGTGSTEELAIRVHFQSLAVKETTSVLPGSTIILEEPELLSIDETPARLPLNHLIAHAYPNPFNSSTTVKLYGGKGSHYDIEIYDIAGRKVKNARIEKQTSGATFFIWDGLENSGVSVQSGVYLCRISSGEYETSLKITLIK